MKRFIDMAFHYRRHSNVSDLPSRFKDLANSLGLNGINGVLNSAAQLFEWSRLI
jgi:hypothetical protein